MKTPEGAPGSVDGEESPTKNAVKKSPSDAALAADGPDELELKLISSGKISDFILMPSDIRKVWKSPRTKDELVKFFQELYKPKSQFEQEKVEYNQINILSEYQYYNMIFAKNELMFDDLKVSVVLDIFWKLLEFNPDEVDTTSGSQMQKGGAEFEPIDEKPELQNNPSGSNPSIT